MAYPPRPVRPLPGTPAEDTEEGARTGLVARIIIVGTIVLGQLWALTVALEAHLLGEEAPPWWLAAFSLVSFAVVLVLVRLDPAPRGSRRRPGRR
jgi:hypothetical protein